MYHIARNVLKDQKFGLSAKYDPIGVHEEKIEDGTLADESLEKKQLRQQLYDAMRMLSEEDREILMLSRIKELKYPEISEIMGVTPGAARVRVFRAVEELRLIFIKKGIKNERI
jgi:RNA polymerase sigma-70 factor (ECF subfamily)